MARANNKYIKSANVEMEYTQDNINELQLCASDPVYFIRNYVQIQHPTKGSVPFELYDFQEKLIRSFHNHDYNIVLASRQVGKSITSAAYLLWYAMFNFDKTILIASNKNSGAMEMIYRIRFAYENLPHWLKPGVTEDGYNKHALGFDNGSRIVSAATSEDTGRGMSISLLFLDEFAFVPTAVADEFWTAIKPTLSTGGACIIASTPNGDMNIFAQIWRAASVKANSFVATWVKWDEPPGRDEKFKEKEIADIGERKWMQEYECCSESVDVSVKYPNSTIKQMTMGQLYDELNSDKLDW